MSNSAVEDRKSDRLVARVSPYQKQLLEQAAALEERTLAGFVVAHAVERAEKVVRERNVFRLNHEQAVRFVEIMSRKPRPLTAASRRAMKAYRAKAIEME
jgi:uncharacterized protein (DUF1778 family)